MEKETKYNRLYGLLEDFVLLIAALYPDLETENRYENKIKLPYPNKELKELYPLLIHSLTLLNHIYREKSHYKFISDKQDLVIALSLIELFTTGRAGKDSLKISRVMKKSYKVLLHHTGPQEKLTAKKIRSLLYKSKSSCHGLIQKLEACGYLKKTGGYKNRGFLYELKRQL